MEKKWSSHLAFVLACIGSAVGVGNIWRFPYLVGEYGGGSFLLMSLVSLFIIGIPLMLLEILTGRRIHSSLVKTFETLNKKKSILVIIPLGVLFIILSYYIVVTGWTLGYFLLAALGKFLPFADFISSYFSVIFTFLTIAILFFIMQMNIKEGVEKANVFLLPLFYLVLIGFFVYSIYLPGFGDAIGFLTKIDLSILSDPGKWLFAISQIIFSLSVGFGILITYSAYMDHKFKPTYSVGVISLADFFTSILAAVFIFSIAFTFNIPPGSGPSLSFESIPLAIMELPYSQIFMFLFFFLLFSAAITSSISLTEVFVSSLEDKLDLERRSATLLVIALLFFLSFPSALSYSKANLQILGKPVLDFLDGDVVGRLAPLSALIVVLYITWFSDSFKETLRELEKEEARILNILGKYVIPAILGLLVIMEFIVPIINLFEGV